eukprot:4339488-Alexandrium_andersonii.AAC.1
MMDADMATGAMALSFDASECGVAEAGGKGDIKKCRLCQNMDISWRHKYCAECRRRFDNARNAATSFSDDARAEFEDLEWGPDHVFREH